MSLPAQEDLVYRIQIMDTGGHPEDPLIVAKSALREISDFLEMHVSLAPPRTDDRTFYTEMADIRDEIEQLLQGPSEY